MIGTYRRRFDGDYKCSGFEVKRMLSDQSDISQDEKVLKNYTMEDINIESLDRYRKRFNAFKPTHTWIALDNKGNILWIISRGYKNIVDNIVILNVIKDSNLIIVVDRIRVN